MIQTVLTIVVGAVTGILRIAVRGESASGSAASVSRGLVAKAVTRLPERHRERWYSEWLADLDALSARPLNELGFALRIAWYAPSVGQTLRNSDGASFSADTESGKLDRTSTLRRYQLRQQGGRFLVLAPLAAALAFVGGFLLQTVEAPKWCFYVFTITLSAGTVMQILNRGAGFPRPGVPRGKTVDLDVLAGAVRSSGKPYHAARQQL